jgi:hypothetical protein
MWEALDAALREGDPVLIDEAARIASVLALPKRARTAEVLHAAVPDLGRLAAGQPERWTEADPPEPWHETYAIYQVVQAFLAAIKGSPEETRLAPAP